MHRVALKFGGRGEGSDRERRAVEGATARAGDAWWSAGMGRVVMRRVQPFAQFCTMEGRLRFPAAHLTSAQKSYNSASAAEHSLLAEA